MTDMCKSTSADVHACTDTQPSTAHPIFFCSWHGIRAVVDFYKTLGFEADPDGIKGMFWYPKF